MNIDSYRITGAGIWQQKWGENEILWGPAIILFLTELENYKIWSTIVSLILQYEKLEKGIIL